MKNKRAILFVSGSIASIKVYECIKQLQEKSFEVNLFLTKNSLQWISKKAGRIISKNEPRIVEHNTEFIKFFKKMVNNVDAIIVFAATANFISALAYPKLNFFKIFRHLSKTVIIIPAMNVMMWQHPATQRNVRHLIDQGFYFIGPALGKMVCGDIGYGRLVEINCIVQEIMLILSKKHSNSYENVLIPFPSIPQNLKLLQRKKIKKILLAIHNAEDILIAYTLISMLRSNHWDVICAIEKNVEGILPVAGLATISNNKVYFRHYQEDKQGMEHIRLSEITDSILMIGVNDKKVDAMMKGRANSFMECIYLASKKPVFLLPTNVKTMRPKESTLELLKNDGVKILSTLNNTEITSYHDYCSKILNQINEIIDNS